MKIVAAIIILSGHALRAFSQGECYQSLVSAEQAYFAGQLKNVESMLSPCLQNGFTKEQKVSGYRLLALSYLFSRKYARSDSAILLLLTANPQYETRAEDPPEFAKRLENFRVHPTWGINFDLGFYQPFFKAVEVYDVRNVPSDVSYKGLAGLPNVSWKVGLSLSYYLNKNLLIEGGFEVQSFSFRVQDYNAQADSRMEEKENRRQFTLATGYSYKIKGISIQLLGGLAYNTLQSAMSKLYLLEQVQTQDIKIYRESPGFSNLDHRAKHDFRPMLLLKAGLPQKSNFVINLFVRYEYGTQNFTTNRNSDPAQMIQYEWVEDNFKANYLSFGLNITKLLYRVKKYEKK